ncbi:predicted protein [Uncinocarpus reesii 1704]|uniref:Uncharacterized protein n=1 Tax=Uncinocarpus reesii (strain UAMH 1704) TaxID=336963 RepID=C4JKE6_UNCRE|nr:uncharacterized protein UREG_02103 [Uncinocarpus reesii 1704]EEP77254.1 predicted protein [Uncinocarpus reesii 1704]
MSLCLAVGSPALITYSLTITMLNRYWVRRVFRELLDNLHPQTRARYKRQVNGVQYFLAEAQQVPIQVPAELSEIRRLLAPGMEVWWRGLNGRLRRSRRGVTASLVAQVLSAVIAYTFTVIASFIAAIDSLDPVMQISAGTLWVWLIPVICGWVIVGTQSSHDAVEDALRVRHLNPSSGVQSSPNIPEPENDGITVRHYGNTRQSLWFGLNFAGDELQKGPVYNYARVLTWWQTVNAFIETTRAIDRSHAAETEPTWQPDNKPQTPTLQPVINEVSESEITVLPISQDEVFIETYPRLASIPPEMWWRIILASLMALSVQWGTTGASVIIAILTPVKGLGCRSGSYALYGVLGTFSWLVLLVSMLLSHAAMSRPARSTAHRWYGRLAIVSRCLGKTIAVINAAWLASSTIFENIGFYDNCWCHSVVLQYGVDAWVILFRTEEEFRREAKNSWPGGIAMTMIVAALSVLVFALGSRNDSTSGDDEYD